MVLAMEYQGNLELYLNMTRKELQKLCKKYHLRANRTHAQLAKSLASHFNKKKRASSAFLGLRSIGPDASSKTSFILESKLIAGTAPPEQINRGAFERSNSFEGVIHRQNSGPTETLGDCRPHCPPGNQTGTNGHMLDAHVKTSCPCPANSKKANTSPSDPKSLGKGLCTAAGIQKSKTSGNLGFECEEFGIRRRSRKSLDPKNTTQMLFRNAIASSRICNTMLVPSAYNKAHESSTESGFVSADEISTRAPSFQFFVMSEEGINLCVDLDSTPFEWIDSLKNEVCIQKAENNELINHTCGLPNSDDCMLPSGDMDIGLQSNEVQGNTGCTNSGLSSVVSENCNSDAYPPDAVALASGSSVLTSSIVPADLSGRLEQNQVVSSSHATYGAQDNLAADIASCPQEEISLVQECDDASCGVARNNASLIDTHSKPTNSKDNSRVTPVTADHTLTVTYDGSDVAITSSDKVNHVSSENKHPTPSEIQVIIEASRFSNAKNQNGVCKSSFTVPHMNELPDSAGIREGSSSSCQPMQMVLDGQMTDALSDAGTTDNKFSQQTCDSFGVLVLEDQMLSINDESDCRTPSKGKENSECSRAQSFYGNDSKRSSNLEHFEKHCKRQHVCGENMNTAIMNSKNIKGSAKETISDPVFLPRRSTRLVPKGEVV